MKRFLLLLCVAPFLPLTDGCRKDYRDEILPVKPEHFLNAKKYKRLEVELLYINGFRPEKQAIDHLRSFLIARLNKPEGIVFDVHGIAPEGNFFYTRDDLLRMEYRHRSHFTHGKHLAVFILFVDQSFDLDNSNSHALGMAFGTTALAVFGKTVHEFSGGAGQPARWVLEATSIEHQFGHLLGLVDHGTPMQSFHRDEANGIHCTSPDCLLHHDAENTAILNRLLGGQVPEADANCQADLRANGGK